MKDARAADDREPRALQPVKARIAAKYGIKPRTLEAIIQGLRARIS